jgi:hypothetical protein
VGGELSFRVLMDANAMLCWRELGFRVLRDANAMFCGRELRFRVEGTAVQCSVGGG